MDKFVNSPTPRAGGMSIELDGSVRIAAIRYFDAGAIGEVLRETLAEALPDAQRVVRSRGARTDPFMLAWRGPTEAWLLSPSDGPIDAVRKACETRDDACVVVQTGGIVAVHACGVRTPDLLARLGSAASIPRPGEARSGRFADVTVTVLGLAIDEMLLLVERAYAEHLLGWIRETLADFEPEG